MKIETSKNYIASVNFHGASSARPEWDFSRTGDGSDLDLYTGSAVCVGNKGDRDSQEWFIVLGEQLKAVDGIQGASALFFQIAEFRALNGHRHDPEGDQAVIKQFAA